MSQTTNAGIVTAYGAAVRGGYQGSYNDFCTDLANLTQVVNELANLSATAETLVAGSAATATYSNGVFSFGIPRGDKGETGDTGNGIESVSLLSTSGLNKTYRITFTDETHFDYVVADGKSIVSTVLNVDYTLTITYNDGTTWTSESIRGATGATPNLTIGTVTTGAAGTPASAEIAGTAEDPVLNLTIPKGADGDVSPASLASTYSASQTYAVGDYVWYSGQLYCCTTAITTAEAWTAAHWTAAKIADDVKDLKSSLTGYVEKAYVTPTYDFTLTGLTLQATTDNRIKVFGTATAVRNYIFLNGNATAKTSSGTFTKTFEAGTYKISTDISGTQSIYQFKATYTTFDNGFVIANQINKEQIVTFTAPAMVGFVSVSNRNYGTSESPTYLSFSAKMLETKTDYDLMPTDVEITDETAVHDVTDEIERILTLYGECHLGEGVFYTRGITMLEGTKISGCGSKSVIKLLASVSSGSAVKMATNCTVENVTVKGGDTSYRTADTEGTRNGIEWTGETNYVGFVNNCIVKNFSGSGIYAHDTEQQTYRNLSIINCYITSNFVGVDIRKNSEFNKISNCTITSNKIGYRNRGGNNILSNCGIDANGTGILINADEGTNNGHGAITNCTINHSGSGSGYGLIVKDTGLMLISNCNIYYSKLKLDTTNGNVISNCGFGRGSPWEVVDGECNLFIGCMVRGWNDNENTNVIITNNTDVKILNCYDRNGTAYSA